MMLMHSSREQVTRGDGEDDVLMCWRKAREEWGERGAA